jgi:transcriptional regulator with XRE-family HTH domain
MINNKDKKILKAFGENLKKLREAKGLTTREFADTADIAYSRCGHWKAARAILP